jgi:hypothetical protein
MFQLPVLGTTILTSNILVMTAFSLKQGKSRPSGDGQPKAAVPT